MFILQMICLNFTIYNTVTGYIIPIQNSDIVKMLLMIYLIY